MVAAQVVPSGEATPTVTTASVTRRQAVDSVLGTMGAEGELPSEKTLGLMEDYVDGRLSMQELVDTIFKNARG